MRILMAGTFPYPEGGAASRAVSMQADGLTQLGNAVTIAVTRRAGSQDPPTSSNPVIRFMCSEVRTPRHAPPRHHWLRAQLGMLAYLLGSILAHKFDSIIFYGVAPVFVPPVLLARLLGQKTSLVQYDLLQTDVFLGWRDRMRRFLIIRAEKLLARNVSLIIVGYSTKLAEVFDRIAPRTPRVQVWPPIDTARFASGNGERARRRWSITEAPLIVYAGSISKLEGIDLLLRAMPRILQRHQDAQLLIAGSVAQYDPVCGHPLDYQQLAKDLGIQRNVVFTGMLPMDALIDLLAGADCLVMPKIDHPANAVASPIKIGEYLASARPVVASRVCELERWLKPGQDLWFCDPGDVSTLADSIVHALDNLEESRKVGASGREAAQEVCDLRVWAQKVHFALRMGGMQSAA